LTYTYLDSNIKTVITNVSYSGSGSVGVTAIPFNAVTSIADNAFSSITSNLTSINFFYTDTLSNIGSNAFQNCTLLTQVFSIPSTITNIGAYAFNNTRMRAFDLSSSTSLLNIGSYAFSNCTNLTSLVSSLNTVTNIGSNAFEYSAFRFFAWPSSVSSVGSSTFFNCTSLTNMSFSSTLTSIGVAAFSRCGFRQISWFPSTVTLIDDSTFSYCTSLTSIQIPSAVSSIDTLAFDNCTALTRIVLPYFLRTRANKTVLDSLSFSNTTAINSTNYSSLTAMLLYGYTTANLTTAGFNATAISLAAAASCFNEGTKILCFKNDKEEYVPIQDLRKGDIVKSYLHGYKKIDLIGKAQLRNNVSNKWKNNMFVMYKTSENNLIEDLIMTGGHSILVDELNRGDFKEEQIRYYEIQKNNPWKIDDKHLLLAGVSKFFKEINDDKIYTYYNFTLENDGDDDKRYGIWANGILAEIPSKTQFISFNEYQLYPVNELNDQK
jgi:hypothetical protein